MIDYAAERRRAGGRLMILAALVGAWCVYALKIPAGSGVLALKDAMVKKIAKPSGSGKASVSWMKDGAPLDKADLSALPKGEAALTGRVEEMIDAARKNGDLDKPALPNGMTYSQILIQAKEAADKANANARAQAQELETDR